MSQAPRLRDVAERAGVSVSQVSNFINRPDQVSKKTSVRIAAAIRDLQFVPNDAARQLRRGISRIVAFVALDAGDPFFTSVARGAQARASEHNLGLVLADTNGDADTERDYVSMFEEQRVRGILLAPVGDPLPYLTSLETRRIPAVLIDHPSPDVRWASVSIDDREGGRIAAAHLLSLGRTRIAAAGGSSSIRQVAQRRLGVNDAVVTVPQAKWVSVDSAARDAAAGRRLATQLAQLRPQVDAVFCVNDSLAIGVLQGLLGLGICVPDDIAIVGYNDTATELSTGLSLSSVRRPHEDFGAAALSLLVEQMEGSGAPRQSVVFQPKLIVRESTGG